MDYTNQEHTITMTAFIPTLRPENQLTYRLSRTIRLLSFFDIFMGLFMFFYGNIGLLIFIRILYSIIGYYGAKHYNQCLSTFYTSFLALTTIGELTLVYYYQQLYHQGLINEAMLTVGISYSILFFLVKLYILRFVCQFVRLLKYLSGDDKTELILYDSQPVEIVYW